MNVLVLIECNKMQQDRIENCLKEADFHYCDRTAVTADEVKMADIIIGNVSISLLGDNAQNLKWLQLNSAGFDGYTDEGVLPKGCILTNATGAYGLAVSEHMLMLTLMLMKKMNLYFTDQQKHLWAKEGKVKSIYNSVFLVIGLGDIGGEYARKVKALGGYVIGVGKRAVNHESYLDEYYSIDSLDQLLPRADVVAMVVPGNQETYHLIDENRLNCMKEDAILINCGRGITVDLDVLCEALMKEKIYGAALDVTEIEPLPSDHPAWDVKNLIITPHVAGGFHLEETFNRLIEIAVNNLKAYPDEQKMKNIIEY